jgi:hypothetical protein
MDAYAGDCDACNGRGYSVVKIEAPAAKPVVTVEAA